MNAFRDFDRYLADRDLGDEDAPAAFEAWLEERTGQQHRMREVVESSEVPGTLTVEERAPGEEGA
jgi:hypothetical protein